MTTAPVPPPPPPTPNTNAQAWWRSSRTWADRNLGKGGTIAAAAAVFLLITTIVATSFWVWNYNSAETWEAAAREARVERDTARSELAGAESRADTLEAASGSMQEKIITLESEASAVAQRATELEEQAAALAEREAAVTATEQQVAANTIQPGRWTVGVDVEPGSYRVAESVVGSRCYWAITRTGSNGRDIVANDYGTQGNLTVTLAEGQDFESSDCGSWVKQ